MNTSAVLSIILSIVFLLFINGIYWAKRKHYTLFKTSYPWHKPRKRKLTPQEREAISQYLNALSKNSDNIPIRSLSAANLTPLNHSDVYPITHAVTRYELANDTHHQRRYYLDNVEVHLPDAWAIYLTNENQLELVKTQSMPLVISLNGHSLTELLQNPRLSSTDKASSVSIHQNQQDAITFKGSRQESYQEYQFSQQGGSKEAIMLVAAMLLFALSLLSPNALLPWFITIATGLFTWGIWLLFSYPDKQELKEIHCIEGTPKRWGLFGDATGDPLNNIYLGALDIRYPSHWRPYLDKDLGQMINIEMYPNRHVVRQGQFLSIHNEVNQFPLQPWIRNAILLCGSLFTLTLLFTSQPLSTPFKLSSVWLHIHNTQHIQVNSVDKLKDANIRIGDTISLSGKGMCTIPDHYKEGKRYPAWPFDCSSIYWNNLPAIPITSKVVNNAKALQATIERQLHTNEGNQKLNPELTNAIQKSGMILLDNFADIVMNTEALCVEKTSCVRLKNALVNLGNNSSWTALLKRAHSGQLKGVNVLLRPASAQQLSEIVSLTTALYYQQEIQQISHSLASLPKGGFLIQSSEKTPFVKLVEPAQLRDRYSPFHRWQELEALSQQLLTTPFVAKGVITDLRTDAKGTQYIVLHSEPNSITLWRYLFTCSLILVVSITLVVNAILLILRIRRAIARTANIQRYYDQCIKHQSLPFEPPI